MFVLGGISLVCRINLILVSDNLTAASFYIVCATFSCFSWTRTQANNLTGLLLLYRGTDDYTSTKSRMVSHLTLTFVFLLSICRGLTAQEKLSACDANADIIFVIDASTSVGEANFREQLTWIADVTDQFRLAENGSAQLVESQGARFGALVYSRDVVPLFRLGAFDKPKLLRDALMSAPYLGESSHTHAALMMIFGLDLFAQPSGGRTGVKDIVVLVTDGRASYGIEGQFRNEGMEMRVSMWRGIGVNDGVGKWGKGRGGVEERENG
ncbi:collagen alpha-1(xii) chain [Plakobranchus ocellatus]|uniref:Collagen alpha-1(Xii) chain n=1 Tax=Plakobranchus ocellatus TaxID=259542 RepID=A0AAV3ZKA6_9GAST|nr:collagen alpha-1(xii) chain [Plakobranchus ocellatus]